MRKMRAKDFPPRLPKPGRMKGRAVVIAAAAFLLGAAPAAAGDASVAALQVRLRGAALYGGAVDGLRGPVLEAALRSFQQQHGLVPDGVVGPRTRAALRAVALGSRRLGRGNRGWDVAELQFLLATRGFPSGTFGTVYGERVQRAVRRFQRYARVAEDGLVGSATLAALRLPPPVSPLRLAWPVQAELGDPFGPRGTRFHTGIDLKAPAGVPVVAAAAGTVTYAGELAGGWGLLVTVAHAGGARTLYAHLSQIDVRVGQRVAAGAQLGLVGATGDAIGPHLHFELRVRGAAIDPLPAFG